jgi:uncharacterized membrane protein YozB (DUF420 family)
MQSTNYRRKRMPFGLILLSLLVLLFLAFSLSPYIGLDPSRSRIPLPKSATSYYSLLIVHMSFATVAMLTCLLQVWPWLRQRHPRIHRISGRIYVFAGVIPAALAGLIIACYLPFGLPAGVSNIMLSLLWPAFTLTGYRMARKKNYEAHQRWMIRSFALTMSIILNRIFIPLTILLAEAVHTPDVLMPFTIAGVVTWLSWTTTLLATEWYLGRVRR